MNNTQKEGKKVRQTWQRLNGIKRSEKEKTNSSNRTKLKQTKEEKTQEKKELKTQRMKSKDSAENYSKLVIIAPAADV